MGISPVGSLQSVAATGATQRPVTTHAAGNLQMVAIQIRNPGTVATAVTGGNVDSHGFVRVAGPFIAFSDTIELWAGTAAGPGASSPVRVAFSGDVSGTYIQIDVQEFTAGLGAGTTWAVDTARGITNTTADDSILYPRLVPAGPGELYFAHGFGVDSNPPRGGISPGYTYLTDNAYDQIVFNPNVSSTAQPTGLLSHSAQSAALAVLMIAVVATTGPGPVTRLAAVTLAGTGTLAAGGTVTTPPSELGVTFLGAGRFQAFAGVAAPPGPPGDDTPPPGGGLPPGPPPPNPPTAAGLTLYGEVAPLAVGDADLGYPLRAFADAGAGFLLQRIDDLVRDTSAGPGWSQAVDPTRAPLPGLPWLGQFVGVSVDVGQTDTAQRAQIVAEAGFARGSLAAIRAAAQKSLAVGQTVTITERSPDPYHFTVTVATAATLTKQYADLSVAYATYTVLAGVTPTYDSFVPGTDRVKAAVAAAKPAGLLFTMITAASAALAGVGALGALAKATAFATKVLAGLGSLAATGIVAVDNASATFLGSGVFAATPTQILKNPTFRGASSMTVAAPAVTAVESATFAGTGSLGAVAAPSGPPRPIAVYYVTSPGIDSSDLSTPTFTPAAGEVLVVKATTDDTSTTIGSVSGGGQAYAVRALLNAASNDFTELWTATVVGTPGPMSVFVPFGGGNGGHSIVVERWANAKVAASPAVGASQSNFSASQTVTTTGHNSIVSWVSSDWNVVNPGSPTYRGSGVVVEGTHYLSSSYVAYFGWQPATNAGVQTFGVSSPTGQKASMAGVEIQSLTP